MSVAGNPCWVAGTPGSGRSRHAVDPQRALARRTLQRVTGTGHVRGVPALVTALVLLLVAPGAEANVTSGPLTFSSPLLVDDAYPFASPMPFDTLSCPATSLCVGDAGNPGGLSDLGPDQLIASTQPGGGAASDWTDTSTAQIAGNASGYVLTGVSCPVATFCLAEGTDGADGKLLTSTDPAGGAGAWKVTTLTGEPLFRGPACASSGGSSVCVAGTVIDQGGIVCADGFYVSADPTGGASTWSLAPTQFNGAGCLGPGSGTGSDGGQIASCPSTTFCIVVDGGYVKSSTPGTASSWPTTPSTITDGPATMNADGISCTSTTFCMAVAQSSPGFSAAVATTIDPTAASPTWKITDVSAPLTELVSCYADSGAPAPYHVICLDGIDSSAAAGYAETVEVSLDGGVTWVPEPLTEPRGTPTGRPTTLACPGAAAALCIAGTDTGAVISSTNAGAGASAAWTGALPVAPGSSSIELAAQSCPSTALCAAIDTAGNVISSTTPTAGGWMVGNVDPTGLAQIACPSTTLCVALDTGGDVTQSTDPGAGPSSWSAPAVIDPGAAASGGGLSYLACPSASLCVALDLNGNVFESSNPGAGAGSWSAANKIDSTVDSISVPNQLSALACPTVNLCVATDTGGNILESRSPATGAWSTPEPIDGSAANDLLDLLCPSTALCLAAGSNDFLTSTSPGTGAWSPPAHIDGTNALASIACASTALCVAADFQGAVTASTQPTSGGSSWSTPVTIDPGHQLGGLACPSNTLCVALDDAGRALTGTPGSAGGWPGRARRTSTAPTHSGLTRSTSRAGTSTARRPPSA